VRQIIEARLGVATPDEAREILVLKGGDIRSHSRSGEGCSSKSGGRPELGNLTSRPAADLGEPAAIGYRPPVSCMIVAVATFLHHREKFRGAPASGAGFVAVR